MNPAAGDTVAMMVIKLDGPPTARLLESLKQAPGILSVASLEL